VARSSNVYSCSAALILGVKRKVLPLELKVSVRPLLVTRSWTRLTRGSVTRPATGTVAPPLLSRGISCRSCGESVSATTAVRTKAVSLRCE
jgi:hypothetical protein